jgi:hypothetical protein
MIGNTLDRQDRDQSRREVRHSSLEDFPRLRAKGCPQHFALNTGCRGHPCPRKRETHGGVSHLIKFRLPRTAIASRCPGICRASHQPRSPCADGRRRSAHVEYRFGLQIPLVLGIVSRDEVADRFHIRDFIGCALERDGLDAVFGTYDAIRIGGEVARLARFRAAAEVERIVEPNPISAPTGIPAPPCRESVEGSGLCNLRKSDAGSPSFLGRSRRAPFL